MRLLILSLLGSSLALGQTESEKLHKLFADAYKGILRESPETASFIGEPGYNDKWSDLSDAGLQRELQFYSQNLKAIATIDKSKLNDTDRINYDLFRRYFEKKREQHEFDSLYMLANQMYGIHLRISITLAQSPAFTLKDFEDRIARMKAATALIDQSIALLNKGLAKGISPPQITLRYLPAQIEGQTPADPAKSPLLAVFEKIPSRIPAADRDRLKTQAAKTYTESLAPALRRFHAYLQQTYIPKARTSTALKDMPNGPEWYAMQVRLMTTTSLTPQQIHDIGLREVTRIRSKMEAIREQAGYKGTLEEFQRHITEAPEFHYKTKEELLAGYREIAKRADPEIPKLFGKLPRMPYGVVAIPDHEAEASAAHYTPPSSDGTRAGYFHAKTYKPEAIAKWTMPSLVLHESVPGHHLQIALALEQPDTPDFRKAWILSAFAEGWGLYAESLGDEMGLYNDPYSKFGQLNSELFRACRLVIDTGLHQLGWSRQQAIDYFLKNTGDTRVSEVDRYIAWPGQALSYKIGELKIKEMRALAEKSLGGRFNLRDFHDLVIGNGSLPLDLLEERVKGWIERQQSLHR
ncbi:MAG TPA: DUF885 domain-containing protein [Bryobacteraceae bacterium]|nr:DUF885 domain-containing protein [Bryobacteraceae bacterium]